jgi:hypothetical protein
MKFYVKNKLNGVIYEDGFPVLILQNIDGNIEIDSNDININLNVDDDTKKEIFKKAGRK